MRIPLNRAYLTGNELSYIKNVLNSHKYDILGALLAMLLTTLFFLPVTNKAVLVDSPTYLLVAQSLVKTHQLILMTHFLYPLMVGIVKVFFDLDYWTAGAVVVILFEAFLTLVLFVLVRGVVKRPGSLRASLLSTALAFSLLLVAPVPLFAFFDRQLYLTYIGINVYHNATIMVLKPLAILLFWAATLVYRSKNNSVLLILSCFVLTALCVSAKPNFIIDLLPVLGLFTLYRIIKKQWINWHLLVLGIGLPAILSLGWQLWYTYTNASVAPVNVIFAPFAVYRLWGDWLSAKFFLSILFPLGVCLLYFQKVLRELELLLAWPVFLFGAACAYLLAEAGTRFGHGNFLWSAQIGLFILFVYTLLFLIKQSPFNSQMNPGPLSEPVYKFWICVGLYVIQLIAGVVYYASMLGIFGRISPVGVLP